MTCLHRNTWYAIHREVYVDISTYKANADMLGRCFQQQDYTILWKSGAARETRQLIEAKLFSCLDLIYCGVNC